MQNAWKDDSYLNGMRNVMDPLADEAVAALFKEDLMTGFITLFKEPLMPDGKPRAGLPPEMERYLIEQAAPPTTWEVDPKLLKTGDDIQSSHGLLTLSILAAASLPECYIDWRGMPVLSLTQQLSRDDAIERRVIETCLYVNYVLSNKGFETGGKALEATRKVRLMHAASRYLILADDEEVSAHLPKAAADRFNGFDDSYWPAEGMPINQEDLAYTLQTFSWVAVRGLRTLELGLDAREEEAIIHCWRLAGHHMGIQDDLVPGTVAESEAAFDQMKARLAYFDEGNERGIQGRKDGVDLTNALMDWTKDEFIPSVMGMLDKKVGKHRHLLTQEKLEPLSKQLMLHLVGEETAGMLGVKRSDFTQDQWDRARRWLWVIMTTARIREWGLDRIPGFRVVSNFAFDMFTGMRWNGIIQSRGWIPFTRDIQDHWSGDRAP